MAYADYNFYVQHYGGLLDEATFHRLAERASLFANTLTGYRLRGRWSHLNETIRQAVTTAICAYADQASVEERGGPIASESNDGISRTYSRGNSGSQSAYRYGGSDTAQGRLAETIRVYLAPTGLLYRGRGR